ncbi:hypothetical protein [Halomarina pelagica]|uniref:hypothetical protein n=1 Tax=Halomarina pelagica TaxID=2961599 RepID=UPI0020C5870B|nr:hypothetical protein [Halomarina sp. BND7]
MSSDLDVPGNSSGRSEPRDAPGRRDAPDRRGVRRSIRRADDEHRFEALLRALRNVRRSAARRTFAEGRIVGTDQGVMFVEDEPPAARVGSDR